MTPQELEKRIQQAKERGETTLDLSGTGIKQLPESIGQLARLRELNLYGNQLPQLPESIGQLAQLRELWLSDNQLTQLPESIGQLAQLRGLKLDDNQLTQLPESIGQLAQLQKLWLDGNQLTQLPESIGQLAQLQELWLHGNQLAQLPESLLELARRGTLGALFLHDNDALGIPPEVFGPRWLECKPYIPNGKDPARPLDILEYYFRTRGAAARPLNEAKLILVGRGAVGKTTLVHQLIHGRFVHKTKTKGIKVSQWKVPGVEGEITAHVWDFGGQEIMHGTHQFFLTERSLYLLVLAGREDREDEDAEYWLKMIRAFGGDSPVIVVLNKFKEHRFEVDEEHLQEKYPNIVAFVETDCRPARNKSGEGYNIAKLRKWVTGVLGTMESVRARFPAAWRRVKERLSDMEENYLPFDEFRTLCAELGEGDAADQEKLAHYLHLLGIALNYRDDPRLRETSVLNPRWVTAGIYKVLNDATIKKRHGLLRPPDLRRILPAKDYPRSMHDFLLQLMRKFELCFPLDDEGRDYLIPELLGKKQPKLGGEFNVENCLCFEYHYGSLLPEGLLPRFIVRAYTRIEDDLRWRSGVVLGWKGARALVKADESEKQVLIRVRGTGDEREWRGFTGISNSERVSTELLALIREHFDTIHRNFAKLRPVEKIRLPDHPGLLVDYAKVESRRRNRHETFQEFNGSEWIDIDASRLLELFDLPGVRRGPEARGAAAMLAEQESLRQRKEH